MGCPLSLTALAVALYSLSRVGHQKSITEWRREHTVRADVFYFAISKLQVRVDAGERRREREQCSGCMTLVPIHHPSFLYFLFLTLATFLLSAVFLRSSCSALHSLSLSLSLREKVCNSQFPQRAHCKWCNLDIGRPAAVTCLVHVTRGDIEYRTQ